MDPLTQKLLSAFDGHDVDDARSALEAGADACTPIRGKPPIQWLLEEYTRSDRLPACLQLLIDRGASLHDPALLPVLMDDADAVRAAIQKSPALVQHRTTLNSAFTSLVGVSLLHVAAEYANINAARALVEAGADVNARAEVDAQGLNGHTPIFHTVNSNGNRSEPIMRLQLDAGAKADVQVAGIRWGQGYEWETTYFDVTPISFAQMGLMPQVHRRESDIYANIEALLKAAGRMVPINNVPNRYLQPKAKG